MTKPSFQEMRTRAIDAASAIEGVAGGQSSDLYVEVFEDDPHADMRLRRGAVAMVLVYEGARMSAGIGRDVRRGTCPRTKRSVLRLDVVTPPLGAVCYAPIGTVFRDTRFAFGPRAKSAPTRK